jgi:hypothetical protein
MDQLGTKFSALLALGSGCSVSRLSCLFRRKMSGRLSDQIGEAQDTFLYGTLVGARVRLRREATCLLSIP